MSNNQDTLNDLLQKFEVLLKKQDDFSKEINQLRMEIFKLKRVETAKKIQQEQQKKQLDKIETESTQPQTTEIKQTTSSIHKEKIIQQEQFIEPSLKRPKTKSNFEKFIGENLINKIGILITIIGVGIGAKYSIENDLISPLTRIILGYFVGLLLLGFGIKLKENYKSYSAVLVSGAMAIMYFITFSAYSFYDLIPQSIAFLLMVVFTIFTVLAALNYNRQVIAHIGLVGAYAVPFLLSNDSGNALVLFSYMAIINTGILLIAFKKYWKPLFYAAFGFTWLIYFSWIGFSYKIDDHFGLALFFQCLFFIIFYTTILAYKLIKKEKFNIGDIFLLLLNSFIFYGLGYFLIINHEVYEELIGLFTLVNAIIHFAIGVLIYKQKLADRNLFFLIIGLVLVFTTLAIPVQLDGNWVTLLWASEAALLFWIGRTKNVSMYEKMAYPLMVLAFFSMLQDWNTLYSGYEKGYPETRISFLFNINFLSSVLFIFAFAFIYYIDNNKKYLSEKKSLTKLSKVISFTIGAILIYSIYNAFSVEIATYWEQLYEDSSLTFNDSENDLMQYNRNYDLRKFQSLSLINYTLVFLSLLAIVNLRKIKNLLLSRINYGLIVFTILSFLLLGLYEISELRESYLSQNLGEYYHIGFFHIGIRYISLFVVAAALFICCKYIRLEFKKWNFSIFNDLFLFLCILWIASSELLHWMDIYDSRQSYKLGLSILWGSYSFLLIAFGIWKNKKHLRIGAIVLFGITLIKLFFYDISSLSTISKTIVFVTLGVLLLLISFLYNKYKNLISDET